MVDTRYFINANTGEILAAGDPTMHYLSNPGRGNVFWPNPINTLNNPTIRDAFNGTADSRQQTADMPYLWRPMLQNH